jgi:serine/threonine-protein kinase
LNGRVDVAASAHQSADSYPIFAEKYEVERVLGRGGMGTIFEARHSRLGHRVAIKVLGEELRAHPDLVSRFEREARAAGSLSSPHAVRIFDIDQTEDGTPFMVMELLEGQDLAQLIEHGGQQPIGAAVRWIVEASDAIAEAHHLGIIHRDIKPSNIFLCSETNSVKVLDFGIAKTVEAKDAVITQTVAPLGTPQYMSPEQARCIEVDARTDIWSLGVTLYELVCGRPPFNHEIAQACIAAVVVDPIPDPRKFRAELPDELAASILRALEKEPADRFASVDEFIASILPFAEETPALPSDVRKITSVRRFREHAHTLGARGDSKATRGSQLELSVPPAVAPSVAATRQRRIRSSALALALALVGTFALLLLPRWTSERSALLPVEPVTTAQASEATPKAAAVATTTVPAEAATPAEAAEEDRAVRPALVEDTPPARVEAPPVRPAVTAVKPAKPAKFVPRPQASGPVRIVGSERLIHGGISNPGF